MTPTNKYRIGLIQTTDALAASTVGGNYVALGGNARDMLLGLFPNFVLNWLDIQLERGKASTDYVAGSLGLADMEALTYLTIPVDSEAYATGGMWAVIYKTFLAYLLIFYVNRLVIGKRAISVDRSSCGVGRRASAARPAARCSSRATDASHISSSSTTRSATPNSTTDR